MPGGVAVAATCACTFFTTFTGASGVTILALGGILLPVLLENGYTKRFSIGLLTTTGSLGLLFPPSLPVIFYGTISHTPIDKLFIAGLKSWSRYSRQYRAVLKWWAAPIHTASCARGRVLQ
jgi:TRAP-type C4-dicarboxylate transport system permease large subunit